MQAILLSFILLFTTAKAQETKQEIPDAPFKAVVAQAEEQVCPGVKHIHRVTEDPMNIHILIVDLKTPGVSIKTCLSNDTAAGVETVRSMAQRKKAIAGVNGDYWGPNGIEQGLTIADGELIIAPKFRAAFAIKKDGAAMIDRWTNGWSWQRYLIAPNGDKLDIKLLNSDCNENWLTLYSSKYGLPSKGDTVKSVTELVLDPNHRVVEVRTDQPGIEIPKGGFVLTGRGTAGEWLRTHFNVGDRATYQENVSKSREDLQQAISAGPRILQDGKFYQDPIKLFPEGEEFELNWKKMHYLQRQPRTAVGVSKDQRKVIFITVDGRQSQFNIGVYQKQMARLLQEFGAWDGMDLDSGGSTTMVIKEIVVNHPSDGAKADGIGGKERAVANGLLIFYDPPKGRK